MLEYFGVITGLLYVALEIKQHRAMWIVGLVTSLVYVFVFFSAKVYAYMGLQVYYVLISVYGFFLWKIQDRKQEAEETVILYSCITLPLAAGVLLAITVVYYALHYVLVHYTDSPVPVGDAFTTAIGIVATWMLARRILEHWYFWILANGVSIYIYYLRELYPTMFLYFCYTLMSAAGLYLWLKKGRTAGEEEQEAGDREPVILHAPYSCVIVANGQFPEAPLPLEMLHRATKVIACDGAVAQLDERGIRADVVVGDLDSIPPAMHKQYADRLVSDSDQETNDLTKAVRFAHRTGEKAILILGATGKREDHTLGNISLLCDYMPLFGRVEMMTDYGLFTPINRTTTFESHPGQQVSVFSLPPEGEITTEGLRWPINRRTLASWWEGTLNESPGDRFTIHLQKQGRVIVYRLF